MYALIALARSAGSGNSVTIIAMITDDGDRAAEALDEARGDQQLLVLRQPAQRRGQREERDAAQEHALAADQVAEPPGQQQEAAERDQVGVDDPGQVGLGEVRGRVWIAGSATFTTEPSSVFMSIARQTTPSAIQRRRLPVVTMGLGAHPGTLTQRQPSARRARDAVRVA